MIKGRTEKLGREHFAAMGRKGQKYKNLSIARIMANNQVSRSTAYRMQKKFGKRKLDSCANCGQEFEKHLDGRCPPRRQARVRKPHEEGSHPSSLT
jgi:hypothetical protein